MTTSQTLQALLLKLDQQSYKAYKQIAGSYKFPDFTLIIDYVQGDPFAAPSRLRVLIPQSEADFPAELYRSPSREIALRDYLNRQFHKVSSNIQERRGSGKSGLIAIALTQQQVLERSAVFIDDRQVEARFVVGLPARGRTILGRQAAELLCEDLPQIVRRSLKFSALNASAIQQHIETVEDADWLRSQLVKKKLVAFIPNGAILPRQSGVDDRPLKTEALPFQSPESLQVTFDRPNQGSISGMGIPQGVTLIVGGGYHGKSTLLKAIALGVYNHIPEDGREQLVTDPNAVKIRAEDGRSIVGVDISPFINRLPQGRSTTQFSTANASGSTSQAANIVEALEVGAKVLLVDEDTSATNFMIRDRRMQALIAKDKEPITPFIDKIRQLYQNYGVSTILVMGGSGDYFDVADTVIAMEDFAPLEVTARAKAIAQQYATERSAEGGEHFGELRSRVLLPKRWDSPREGRWSEEREDRSPKLKVRDVDELVFGSETVDLSAVEQLVEAGQLRAIGAALTVIQENYLGDPCGNGEADRRTLAEIVDRLMGELAIEGLDHLSPNALGDLAAFRRFELAAVVCRLRSLGVSEEKSWK
jgi:predicted ABC-class ATPase